MTEANISDSSKPLLVRANDFHTVLCKTDSSRTPLPLMVFSVYKARLVGEPGGISSKETVPEWSTRLG